MRVLFLAAESAPLAKVGGLGDVVGELPLALASLQVEVRRSLPFYTTIERDTLQVDCLAQLAVEREPASVPAQVWETDQRGGPVYLIDGAPVLQSPGVYGSSPREADKFLFSSLAALQACEVLGWRPHVVHAHDWHAALALVKLATLRRAGGFWGDVRTVLTIHNLPYMGEVDDGLLRAYRILTPQDENIPDWARRRPLALGISAADWVTTVSPGYAKEILTPAFGSGLEKLLESRAERLVGILNGIDQQAWNPEQDPDLPVRYGPGDLNNRKIVKQTLQSELELPLEAGTPLMGMVTRLDPQKGVDLVVQALGSMRDRSWQLVILGSGEQALQEAILNLASAHPDRVRLVHGFRPGLARRIYGGADMILVPSRYEPCGLVQMIGMRYGCIPVARATGGLKDTIRDVGDLDDGTGFLFQQADSQSLKEALLRALAAYADQAAWKRIQTSAMSENFGWEASARRYAALYDEAMRVAPA